MLGVITIPLGFMQSIVGILPAGFIAFLTGISGIAVVLATLLFVGYTYIK